MGIEASAKITLVGGPSALKELQGVTRGTKDASKATTAAAKENAKWAQQAIRLSQQRIKSSLAAHAAEQKAMQRTATTATKEAARAAAAKAKADQDAVRSAQKTAQEIDRIAQKQADYWARLAQKSADVNARAAAKKTADAQREAAKQIKIAERTAAAEVEAARKRNRELGGLIGVATAGALAGGLTAVNTARGATGHKSVSDRVQAGNEFRERLVTTASSAGLSTEDTEKAQANILSASVATGTDAGDILGAVEEGQAQFNALPFFADNIKEIATIAKSAGADTKDLAVAMGTMRQAFGLTDKEAIESAYLIKAAADKGSIEAKNFAKDFAAGAGIFATNTKQKGLGGVRQMLGMAQGIGSGLFGSAESATRFERLTADLNDVEVRKGLSSIGIKNVADRNGKVDVGNLIRQLSTNRKFQNAGTRQGIFKETRSLQAVEALMAADSRARSGDPKAVAFSTIAGVDADAGRASVAAGFERKQGEGFFKQQQENAKMQAETTANLEGFNSQLGFVNEAADYLESAFGSLSIWASSIAAIGITGIGGSILKGALGGKDKVSALEKLGGVASKAGGYASKAAGWVGGLGATAAGGGVAGAATMAGGALVAGAAGYAVGEGINATTSYFREDKKSASDLLADLIFSAVNGGGAARNRIGGTSTTTVSDGKGGTKEIVTVLERIDSGLRASGAKPAPGGPREPR